MRGNAWGVWGKVRRAVGGCEEVWERVRDECGEVRWGVGEVRADVERGVGKCRGGKARIWRCGEVF